MSTKEAQKKPTSKEKALYKNLTVPSRGSAYRPPATINLGQVTHRGENEFSHLDPADQVRACVQKMGGRGLRGIARVFKKWDTFKRNKLDFQDLKNGLHDHGFFMSDKEIKRVIELWDMDGNQSLGYDDFLVGMKGSLNTTRKSHVTKAFGMLDLDGSGTIDMSEIKVKYNAKSAPEVKQGKKTEEEVLLEFMSALEGPRGDGNGLITREEFEEYYKGISASIDSDRYFTAMMESAWNTKKAPPAPAELVMSGRAASLAGSDRRRTESKSRSREARGSSSSSKTRDGSGSARNGRSSARDRPSKSRPSRK